MITIGETKLEEAQLLLRHIPNAFPRAAANAINRAAEGARTEAVRQVKKRYVITPGHIRETMGNIKRANPAKLSASFGSIDSPRPLSYFKIRPGSKSRPLHATVERGGGGTIDKSFFAQMTTVGFGKGRRAAEPGQGHEGVFNRLGKARLPITERYGPSVAQMMGHPSVVKQVESIASQRLSDRLDHEVSRILQGAAK